jgi:hypothetical protein
MRHTATAMSVIFFFLFFIQSIGLSSAFSQEGALELAPIFKAGTPGDVLMADPVVPARRGESDLDSGSGSIQKGLSDSLPFSVLGTGLPGGIAQFRGVGRSAEDTDVQSLGIPLNAAQGGGFDLAIFPQFIWSGYEYQLGPALGTFDPRGTSGSLTLIPWSAMALSEERVAPRARATAFYSSAKLGQISVAGRDGSGRAAAVVGESLGDARGPSLAVGGRVRGDGGRAVTLHLLATDLDVSTPGPGGFSPDAHQRTARVIPVVQGDLPFGDLTLLKTSVYYDWSYLRYDDPSASALPQSQDRIQQLGTENVLLYDSWKWGAGVRGVKYQTLGHDDLSEAVANLQVSRSFEEGAILIEPTLRGVGVSRYGVLPEASLGVRRELEGGGRDVGEGVRGGEDALSSSRENASVFARAGLSRHFPSLVNRYYSLAGSSGYPGFQGNPALEPEHDWTLTTGMELRRRALDVSVQFYAQYADDAQVRVPLDGQTETVANRGQARILSMTPTLTVRPVGWLDVGGSFTVATSRVSETGLAFTGLPGALGLLSVGVHGREVGGRPGGSSAASSAPRWQAHAVLRASSASVGDLRGNILPPYQEVNLDASAWVWRNWSVSGRLANVFDRSVYFVPGYPSLGRTASALISAEW